MRIVLYKHCLIFRFWLSVHVMDMPCMCGDLLPRSARLALAVASVLPQQRWHSLIKHKLCIGWTGLWILVRGDCLFAQQQVFKCSGLVAGYLTNRPANAVCFMRNYH
jgi:hypothetical protein